MKIDATFIVRALFVVIMAALVFSAIIVFNEDRARAEDISMMQFNIGKEIILAKDTLVIVNYIKSKKPAYLLSNGLEIDRKYAESLIIYPKRE